MCEINRERFENVVNVMIFLTTTEISDEIEPVDHGPELYCVEDGFGNTLRIYSSTLVFSPPVYRQRYLRVKEIIEKYGRGKFSKVTIFLSCYL